MFILSSVLQFLLNFINKVIESEETYYQPFAFHCRTEKAPMRFFLKGLGFRQYN